MDTVALYITARIVHLPIKVKRIVLSAVFGAFLGTFMTIFLVGSLKYIEPFVTLLLSYFMIKIAFPIKIKLPEIIRLSLILWGVGVLLGGVMTFIITTIGSSLPQTNNIASDKFFEIFIITSAVSCSIVRLFLSKNGKKSADVMLSLNNKTYCINALCDTGSSLADPITSQPVILVSAVSVPEIASQLKISPSADKIIKLRVIPMKTASGERILYGFVPDKLEIDGKNVSGVIAIDFENDTYSGYSGVIPSALI